MARELDPVMEEAGRSGWSHEHFLRALCDLELARRAERKQERLLKASRLPAGKTLAMLDQNRLPLRVRRQAASLLDGHFVERAENVLAFGLPGRGKTHLCCAIAHELIVTRGYKVLFIPAVHLVQQLLVAKRDLHFENALRKLDGFDVVVLDDIGYIQQNRDEMEVLFTFLSERYERKSLMITSNLVFSEWDKIFKDPLTTAAAIDRLVHHSIILELDGQSYRMEHAKTQKKGSK
jgi:DNA replication protein DnaC